MTKLHVLIIVLGSALFLWEIPYGVGWLFGWVFVGLLRQNREKVLDRVIDMGDFSVKKYVLYLFGVMLWIAIPLIISFLLPEYINPFAVFGAIFVDRALMFFVGLGRRKT